MCKLDETDLHGTFKFNSYSELGFDIGRTYVDAITGETKVNPYYDKIEALRLVELENFGYFEIQTPDLKSDGVQENKSIEAYSLEYTLSQKYLSNFYINTGEVDSVEVINAEDGDSIIPVQFYDISNKKLSLLHLILEKAYGWEIGHVDESLKTMTRTFEIDRQSIYDFIINEMCPRFNCYAVFDTYQNTINFYAEAMVQKFVGDGETRQFTISPPFNDIGIVSVNGYKTSAYIYDTTTGILTLDSTPLSGEHIEVVDGALAEWETDVFVSFDNLSQEATVSYSADDIKTVLTVTGGEDLDIREVNLGLPYITDLSYYYTVDWMGQDLYDAYTSYMQKCNSSQIQYTLNAKEALEVYNRIDFEENRLSLRYLEASVNVDTVGTYYIRGGESPNYYYTEVSLPAEYNSHDQYYTLSGYDLTQEKVRDLYLALRKCFQENYSQHAKKTAEQKAQDIEELNTLLDSDFSFISLDKRSNLYGAFNPSESVWENLGGKEDAVNAFLDEMWDQVGRQHLQWMYLDSYKKIQSTNAEAGWSQKSDINYAYYYTVYLIVTSIEKEISERDMVIEGYWGQYDEIQGRNKLISDDLSMESNFTDGQLIRLSAFLREDEFSSEDHVETSADSISDMFKTKQELLETGKIELNKICQPRLAFTMSMANIFALKEFEPIVNQFQLGNVIKVGLREDYIKRSRLLQVEINFEDFSDFSCEFGEMSSLRSPIDIHADLLEKALSAGKSVASNSSKWDKGADQANEIDLRIQRGLLDATTAIKSIDGTQNVFIDQYGIHLQNVNPDTGEVDPKQGWIVNNQFLYSSDGFKSTESIFGEYQIDGEDYWGILAKAVIAGYIEGSAIEGGTIKIGKRLDGTYNFEVDNKGIVTIRGGEGTSQQLLDLETRTYEFEQQLNKIQSKSMYRVETICLDQNIMTQKYQTARLICKVYSWDEDVTDTIDESNFNWIRVSSDTEQDEIWNEMQIHKGVKNLTISTEDILNSASFSCQVNIPD